ncbi:ubiquitin carboxyl-terminal hydrolase [Anaeramoeba flamelloides]|uniref:Ubiquitin carboxyl-terminal hydrolase n=1 Tax=Anaeramoeba flamelloides TaxID=1746091 RepID=A0AAV7ZTK8_9EUKA|nr:ubiquitin carboxyl-terminal hydrolase [Anaeramoeba flamelloides]
MELILQSSIDPDVDLSFINYEIISNSLKIIIKGCLNIQDDWRNSLKEYEQIKKWLKTTLLLSNNYTISQQITDSIITISRSTQSIDEIPLRKFFYDLIFGLFSTFEIESTKSDHYFNLLIELIDLCFQSEDSKDFDPLFIKIINKIQNSKIIEKWENNEENNFDSNQNENNKIKNNNNNDSNESYDGGCQFIDYTLIGYMKVLTVLLKNKPIFTMEYLDESLLLLGEIFWNCLYKFPKMKDIANNQFLNAFPKCKSKKSRGIAHDLLIELVKSNEILFQQLIELLNDQISKIKIHNTWYYSPQDNIRSKLNYPGLRNLGSTCYMNSLLQQMFMIPEFRVGILKTKINEKKENLFYQLQQLLVNYLFSKKKFVNTEHFVENIKDFEGNKLNPRIQQDVDEFFNGLFDKLGEQLKKEGKGDFLYDLFGGKLVNQIIGIEEEVKSERYENFFAISLDLTENKNLEDSLKKYITGEKLVGENQYHSEELGRKINAMKRVCIDTLPKNLILHIKRFKYNLTTFERFKVNDVCEFPMILDMYKYTKRGILEAESQSKMHKIIENERKNKQKMQKSQIHNRNNNEGIVKEKVNGKEGEKKNKKENEKQKEKEIIKEKQKNIRIQKEEKLDIKNKLKNHDHTKKDIDQICGKENFTKVKKKKKYFRGNDDLNDEDCFNYELTGIIIHSGTCHGGHYYSFIKERNNLNKEGRRWLKFDDTNVSLFNISKLKEECFGGEIIRTESDFYGQKKVIAEPIQKSAYMLIYQRVDTLKKKINHNVINISKYLNEYKHLNNIIQTTFKENLKFLFKQQLFNINYFTFFQNFIESNFLIDSENNQLIYLSFELALNFLNLILFRSKMKEEIKNWIPIFKKCFYKNKACIELFLNKFTCEKKNWLTELYYNCPNKQLWDIILPIIIEAILIIIKDENEIKKINYDLALIQNKHKKFKNIYHGIYNLANFTKQYLAITNELKVQSKLDFQSISIKILDHLSSIVDTKNYETSDLSNYFSMMITLIKSNHLIRRFLIQNNFISKLLDLFLESKSPLKKESIHNNNNNNNCNNNNNNNNNSDLINQNSNFNLKNNFFSNGFDNSWERVSQLNNAQNQLNSFKDYKKNQFLQLFPTMYELLQYCWVKDDKFFEGGREKIDQQNELIKKYENKMVNNNLKLKKNTNKIEQANQEMSKFEEKKKQIKNRKSIIQEIQSNGLFDNELYIKLLQLQEKKQNLKLSSLSIENQLNNLWHKSFSLQEENQQFKEKIDSLKESVLDWEGDLKNTHSYNELPDTIHANVKSKFLKPLYLSDLDSLMLLRTKFWKFAIREELNTEFLGKILLHCCWNNKILFNEIVNEIMKKIENVHYTNLGKNFTILSKLLQINDPQRDEKLKYLMNKFCSVLKMNITDNTYLEVSVQFLREQIKTNINLKDWLFDNQKNWVCDLLINNNSDLVRTQTTNLIKDLLPKFEKIYKKNDNKLTGENGSGNEEEIEGVKGEERKEKVKGEEKENIIIKKNRNNKSFEIDIFNIYKDEIMFLLKYLSNINLELKQQLQNFKNFNQVPADFFKYTEYFNLLIYLMKNEQLITLFENYFEDFFQVLISISKKNITFDLNLKSALELWQKCLEFENLNTIDLVVNSKEKINDILSIKFEMTNNQLYKYTNINCIKNYIEILIKCIHRSEDFTNVFKNSNTFKFLITNFGVNQKIFPKYGKLLMELFTKFTEEKEYRNQFYKQSVDIQSFINSPENGIHFLNLILKDKKDFIEFSKNGYHDQLSQFIIYYLDKIENIKQIMINEERKIHKRKKKCQIIENIFTILLKITDWFNFEKSQEVELPEIQLWKSKRRLFQELILFIQKYSFEYSQLSLLILRFLNSNFQNYFKFDDEWIFAKTFSIINHEHHVYYSYKISNDYQTNQSNSYTVMNLQNSMHHLLNIDLYLDFIEAIILKLIESKNVKVQFSMVSCLSLMICLNLINEGYFNRYAAILIKKIPNLPKNEKNKYNEKYLIHLYVSLFNHILEKGKQLLFQKLTPRLSLKISYYSDIIYDNFVLILLKDIVNPVLPLKKLMITKSLIILTFIFESEIWKDFLDNDIQKFSYTLTSSKLSYDEFQNIPRIIKLYDLMCTVLLNKEQDMSSNQIILQIQNILSITDNQLIGKKIKEDRKEK